MRCRVFRRTPPDCGWLPSNQRLGEACGGATDGQTGRYGVFTVSKCESFLLRRLGVSTGRWGGNLGFKAREVGKRPKCRVSWGKEKIHRPQALCFSGSQNSASGSEAEILSWQEALPGSVYAYYWRRWSNRIFFFVNADDELVSRLHDFAARWERAKRNGVTVAQTPQFATAIPAFAPSGHSPLQPS